VSRVRSFPGQLGIVTPNGAGSIPRIIRLAQDNGIAIDSVTLKRPGLEDVFMHFTGRGIREEKPDETKR
jgi:ABC-2 type transport system ATP-binding protein